MLTLNDGRAELWQWDTGRTLTVDADCSQVHFSNKVFGRSIDVDVVDGAAIIPDILLQTDKDLNVWAFVGTAENGYTKISKTLKVNRRNKPEDYVFTPVEQTTLAELSGRIDRIEESQDPDAIKNAVADYISKNPITVEETDPTVPAWAKEAQKPSYTASEVGADPSGTAAAQVTAHNTAEAAHNDIRLLISGLTNRLNALADSDDTTLDQLSEVVLYIKNNRELISAITTDKVSVADIIDNLTTNVSNKPLSAAQGVALKALIDTITVPDKLPNPNALTFTGAVSGSYDGSAPLSVEIPQGGGGGSVETYTGEYELIVDHTVTAEEASASSFTFTKDAYPLINGQKLLVLVIEMPDTVSMPWSVLKAGNDDVIWNSNGTANCIRGFSAVLYNRWFYKSEFLTNKNVDTNLCATIAIIANRDPSFRSKPYKEYTSITLYSYVEFLAEGTVIKIYGGK